MEWSVLFLFWSGMTSCTAAIGLKLWFLGGKILKSSEYPDFSREVLGSCNSSYLFLHALNTKHAIFHGSILLSNTAAINIKFPKNCYFFNFHKKILIIFGYILLYCNSLYILEYLSEITYKKNHGSKWKSCTAAITLNFLKNHDFLV